MDIILSASGDLLTTLRRHLAADDAEQVAFLLANKAENHEFQLTAIYCVPSEEFEHQQMFHVTLKEEVRPKVIKWAWDQKACLVEAHSHLENPAALSPSDMAGLADFVPHVWWRLGGRPYVALVFAGDTFDGLAWIEDPHSAFPLVGIRDQNTGLLQTATGLSFSALARRSSSAR